MAKFREDLMKGNLEKYGFEFKPGIIKSYTRDGIEFNYYGGLISSIEIDGKRIEINYYGGVLSSIEIDGERIEDLVDIPEPDGPDDELAYRLNAEGINYLIQLIMN